MAQPNANDPAALLFGIRLFVLDMDGTVYLGDEWLHGAPAFLQKVEATGRNYIFLTNNSSKSSRVYVDKLQKMGLQVGPEKIVTSGAATVDLLRRKHAGKRVFLLGNPLLREEFAQAGVVLDDKTPELVVTAFDTTLDYEKLCAVCDFVRAGLPYLATHPDKNCPTPTGFVPDIGSFHALIEASTGRWPDHIVGKPNGDIVAYALRQAGAACHEAAMVGDRMYTDIAAGVNAGLLPILVLSGETKPGAWETAPAQPALVFGSVAEIIQYL